MTDKRHLFEFRLEDVGVAPGLFKRLGREQQTAIRKIIHSVYDWSPFVTCFYTFALVIANVFPILLRKHDPYDYLHTNMIAIVFICYMLIRERSHNNEKIGYIYDILACKEPQEDLVSTIL